jgi:HTH-type transcriptional repressor of puuD
VGTVLEGSVVLSLAGQTYQLCAGDSYVIDTGEPHSFSNPSGQVCRIVSAHTPASF